LKIKNKNEKFFKEALRKKKMFFTFFLENFFLIAPRLFSRNSKTISFSQSRLKNRPSGEDFKET